MRRVLLILVAVLLLAGLGFLVFTKGKQKVETAQPSPPTQQSTVKCKRFTNIEEAVKDSSIACVLDLSTKEATSSAQDLSKLTQLPKLNTLILKGHKLVSIPVEVTSVKGLITLDLSNNQIKEIPTSITNLTKLEVLDLSNNQISTINEEIGKSFKPLAIKLKGNPIQSKELIKQTFPQTTIQF